MARDYFHTIYNEKLLSNNSYLCPNTGNEYPLDHLNDVEVPFSYQYRDEPIIKNGKKQKGMQRKGTINLLVKFSCHCYTRTRIEGEETPVLATEMRNQSVVEERVFDLDRYDYTSRLLHVIKSLSLKLCYVSRQPGKAIRLEEQDKQNPMKGNYIVMKLHKSQGRLVLFVETSHKRNNTPYDANLMREPERYAVALGRWLKEEWPENIADTKTP